MYYETLKPIEFSLLKTTKHQKVYLLQDVIDWPALSRATMQQTADEIIAECIKTGSSFDEPFKVFFQFPLLHAQC